MGCPQVLPLTQLRRDAGAAGSQPDLGSRAGRRQALARLASICPPGWPPGIAIY
jgi:hypothetical protein